MSAPPTDLWLIHGNLQTPAVWADLAPRLTDALVGRGEVAVHAVDLWANPQRPSLSAWAEAFCGAVASAPGGAGGGDPAGPARRHALVGYSLGGRLALHAILERPELFSAAVVVAADTGLPAGATKEAVAARAQRLAADRAWARRFRDDPWEEVVADWDRQPVFAGRPNAFPPREGDFAREQVAAAFAAFSKGHQDDLLPRLAEKVDAPPLLFLAGGDDPNACAAAKRAARACPAASATVIPGAAHRVPWEARDDWVRAVAGFLADI